MAALFICAGGSLAQAATNPVATLKIEGALPTQLNQAQQTLAGMMFILARNDLASTPDGLSDPWPCVDGTEAGVFLLNSFQAYDKFKAGVVKQGYKLDREIPGQDEPQRTFQFSKGSVVLLGMWAKAAAGDRSTLVICQRAANWKPVAPPTAPAAAPSVKGNVLTGKVSDWDQGERFLVVLAPVKHEYWNEEEEDVETPEDALPDYDVLASGKINAMGSFNLSLPMGKQIPPNLLRSADQAFLSEDESIYSDAPCPPKGALTISDTKAQGLSFDTFQSLPKGFKGTTNSAREKAVLQDAFRKPGSTDTRSYSSALRLVYMDRPVTIKGKMDCAGGMSEIAEVNLKLPAGWSYIQVLYPNGSNEADHTRYENAPAVKLDLWEYVKADQ